MRSMFSVAAVVVAAMLAAQSVAQVVANRAYSVNYIDGVKGESTDDKHKDLRIINTGQTGSPISPDHGTVCADIYVFDANQEMLECCSCPITANGLLELNARTQLLNSPLTGVVPDTGVLKIVSDRGCDPTSIPSPVDSGTIAYIVKLLDAATPKIVEDELQPAPLTQTERSFLGSACSFVLYLGSGRGRCLCPLQPN